MFIILLTVSILTVFLLITLRPKIIYKLNRRNNKEELSYRALIITTLIIIGLWFVLYIFCSTDTNINFDSLNNFNDD